MSKYRIEHDRPDCISCSACVGMAEELFFMDKDNLATLKEGKSVDGKIFMRDIPEELLDKAKDAMMGCPVNIIIVKDTETDKVVD